MKLLTESDEKEIAKEVAASAGGSEDLDALVLRCIEESGGRMNPATARRLLRNRLPRFAER
jgi:hypothetical protein